MCHLPLAWRQVSLVPDLSTKRYTDLVLGSARGQLLGQVREALGIQVERVVGRGDCHNNLLVDQLIVVDSQDCCADSLKPPTLHG